MVKKQLLQLLSMIYHAVNCLMNGNQLPYCLWFIRPNWGILSENMDALNSSEIWVTHSSNYCCSRSLTFCVIRCRYCTLVFVYFQCFLSGLLHSGVRLILPRIAKKGPLCSACISAMLTNWGAQASRISCWLLTDAHRTMRVHMRSASDKCHLLSSHVDMIRAPWGRILFTCFDGDPGVVRASSAPGRQDDFTSNCAVRIPSVWRPQIPRFYFVLNGISTQSLKLGLEIWSSEARAEQHQIWTPGICCVFPFRPQFRSECWATRAKKENWGVLFLTVALI